MLQSKARMDGISNYLKRPGGVLMRSTILLYCIK